MKLSEKWLREFTDPPVTTEVLAEKLTLSGLEVESVTPVAGAFTGVYVAVIRNLRPHPHADRLRVGDAEVSRGERHPIVTGAANVREGMRVPLAKEGAVLASGRRVERAKLHGVDSAGMLCSAVDLGIAEAAEGVMELPEDAPPEADVREYLALDDVSLELNVTPNRGDCLSVLGIAREAAALFACKYADTAGEAVRPVCADRFPIEVSAPSDCPRYAGRVIRNIDRTTRTPVWLSERLRRSGLRCIHPVVDITNYVMLEFGQPLHAFDLSALHGGICVRRGRDGESLALLDGSNIVVGPDALVIADNENAVALAGIMGGAETGVAAGTSDIFLESAFFLPSTIAACARERKLQTDSSQRFERGVDFTLQARAAERATALIVAICGGEPGPLIEVASSMHLPARPSIVLRGERLQRALAVTPQADAIGAVFGRLGMAALRRGEDWLVTPPAHRFDVAIEADLIEEAARTLGYEQIPIRLPGGRPGMHPVAESAVPPLERASEILAQRGYYEAITYSFVDAALARQWRTDCEPLPVANPISSDRGVMRTSLWPGLVGVLLHNVSRQQQRVRLFEVGRIFEVVNGTTNEINCLSGVVAGASAPEQWGIRQRQADFFDVKADVETVLSILMPRTQLAALSAGASSVLHVGQAAEFVIGATPVATVGAVHPELLRYHDIRGPIYVFEIRLDRLPAAGHPRYLPQSRYPAVRRDISVLVERTTPASAVTDCVRAAGPEQLRELQLFDVYEGEGIDSGKKSIALGLTFQGSSSTLMEGDIEKMVAAIVSRLAEELGATLRDS